MNTTFSAFCYAFCLPKFWESLSRLCWVFIAAFFIAMLGSTASHAKLVEEVIKVPVVVKNN